VHTICGLGGVGFEYCMGVTPAVRHFPLLRQNKRRGIVFVDFSEVMVSFPALSERVVIDTSIERWNENNFKTYRANKTQVLYTGHTHHEEIEVRGGPFLHIRSSHPLLNCIFKLIALYHSQP